MRAAHPNSTIGRASTARLMELATDTIRQARRGYLSHEEIIHANRALQLVLLQPDDREEWNMALSLRHAIDKTRVLKVF